MSDSDLEESTDDDLIREVLDLRPDQTPGDSPVVTPTAQVECEDPFSTIVIPEPSVPVASKKRVRRLQDSDEEDDGTLNDDHEQSKGRIGASLDFSSDDDDDVVVKAAVPNEQKHHSGSQDKGHEQIDNDAMSIDCPEGTQVNQSRLRKKRPVISDDSDDDDIFLKATPVNDVKKGNSVAHEKDDQAEDDNAVTVTPHRSSQLMSSRKRPVISDESDGDSADRQNDGDKYKNKVSPNYKRKRPVADECDDDDEAKERNDIASWQSEGEESTRGEPTRTPYVKSSTEPAIPASDSDESDLDRVILKKHCSTADRRSKYASKPNPEFLHDLLKRICCRSRHLGLGGSGMADSKSDSPVEPSEATAANDRTDNDSIELEFSDDGERQLYNEHFQSQKGRNQSGLAQV